MCLFERERASMDTCVCVCVGVYEQFIVFAEKIDALRPGVVKSERKQVLK